MPQISGKIITNASFSRFKFDFNIYAVMLAMVGLAFLSANLNGSYPDVISFSICIFCKNIIWLEKWTWAKLYKTVHAFVRMISCLNGTGQLTYSSIFDNLK